MPFDLKDTRPNLPQSQGPSSLLLFLPTWPTPVKRRGLPMVFFYLPQSRIHQKGHKCLHTFSHMLVLLLLSPAQIGLTVPGYPEAAASSVLDPTGMPPCPPDLRQH